ncbi:FAD-binding oxidoreductase [Pseudonocardia sp. H11422]|uniref:FAD-binding oxidoreductase n=1 Tax=Pseudonocardia sp. H11422 TaxID=2835866 RepID=UPI001BDD5FC3|nr:FAD-binding oxidoreductase [Pseudonocardia sp. H11422]
MSSIELDHAARSADFAGELVRPGDPSYDEARTLFNAMIDRRPAAIARCASAGDVAGAIRMGRERGLEIAVRGGGHGVAGKALTDGGLVVDLRRMNAVTVDPRARTATVAGGALMSDLDRATAPHGLATTGGRVSTTGVAGLTLGGGNGWLDRRFGLACDNLLSVDLVTADGGRLRASETENADLFWALHGGGGNFGVAVSLTFRLYPLSMVTVAKLLWPSDAAPAVAWAYRDYMETAPDEIGSALLLLTAPPADFVPPHLVGRPACAVVLMYAGTGPEARGRMAPMLALGHEAEMLAEVAYADFQCMNEDPPGFRNHWSADHLACLPDDAVDTFCAHAAGMLVPSPSAQALIPQGGAIARGRASYPIPWRQAPWHVARFAMWADPADDDRATTWARGLGPALGSWTSGDVYLNFTGDEGRDRVVAGLGAENYARLTAVKARFDPDNLFHLNHNIAPG